MGKVAKIAQLLFKFSLLAITLFVQGCATVPSAIEFDPASIHPQETMGILVTHSYPYVSTGGLPDMLVDGADGKVAEFRKQLRKVIKKAGEAMTQDLVENWPEHFPPNPVVVQGSDIIRTDKKIDYPATAISRGVDVLLHISLSASLTTSSSGRSLNAKEFWLASTALNGRLIRSSNDEILWKKPLRISAQVAKQKYVTTWSNELETKFDKNMKTLSTRLQHAIR